MKAETVEEAQKWEYKLNQLYQDLPHVRFEVLWTELEQKDFPIYLFLCTKGETSSYGIKLSDEQVLDMIEGAAEGMHERASELNEMVIEYRKGRPVDE